MSPIGAIALATIFDFKKLCEAKSETCEEIIKELEIFSEKVEKIGDDFCDEIGSEKSTNPKKLQKLQKYKRRFYKDEFLSLVNKFNELGLTYIPKKKPFKREYLLEKDYDDDMLESIIKKHYSDIKVYFTIVQMRSDVYFTAKKNKKTKKEIYKMLDDFYVLLTKRVVNSDGKIEPEVEK